MEKGMKFKGSVVTFGRLDQTCACIRASARTNATRRIALRQRLRSRATRPSEGTHRQQRKTITAFVDESTSDECTSLTTSSSSSGNEAKGRSKLRNFAAALSVLELGSWVSDKTVARAATMAEAATSHHAAIQVGHLVDKFVFMVETTAASSGPFGWCILTGVITGSELLPLVPTQPLALVSGLLFGASKGAMITLMGTTTAASVAFLLSSGPVGNKMRDLVMQLEGEESTGGNTISSNPVLKKLASEVEDLDPMKQMMSVILLRLSPVVPFSISNYMLGLTPIRFLPFSIGTFLGMSPWCLLYATLGKTAGSILLQKNNTGDTTMLSMDGLEDLGNVVKQQLGQYSIELELLAVATAFMLGLFIFNTLRTTGGTNIEDTTQ